MTEPETNKSGGAATAGSGSGARFATEWPVKAADVVDLVVDTIHDKAVRPILLAVRVMVFGLLVAALTLVVLVLLSIGLLRLLDVYAFSGRVWISYAVLGGVFTLAGLFSWSRRIARANPSSQGK